MTEKDQKYDRLVVTKLLVVPGTTITNKIGITGGLPGDVLVKGTDGLARWEEPSSLESTIKSIAVENLGMGQEVVETLPPTQNEDVIIKSRTLISGDSTITFTPLPSGEIDMRSNSGGGPTPTTGTVTTTNATVTTLQAISLPMTNRVYNVRTYVVARSGLGVIIKGASFDMNVAFKTHSGIIVQQIGTVTKSAHTDDDDWDANFFAAPATAELRVVGVAGTTIHWRSITYILISD